MGMACEVENVEMRKRVFLDYCNKIYIYKSGFGLP